MAQRRRWMHGAVAVAVPDHAAFGGGNKVGEGLDVGSAGDGGPGCRLGECTTTTPAPAPTTTAPTATTTTAAKPTKAAAPTTMTTARRQSVFAIKIQSDSAGSQFSPSVAMVSRGSAVRWTNTDTFARSVEADNGAFKSPMPAPGASFDYTAATAGRYEYHDGTRPYAIAYLDVT